MSQCAGYERIPHRRASGPMGIAAPMSRSSDCRVDCCGSEYQKSDAQIPEIYFDQGLGPPPPPPPRVLRAMIHHSNGA